MVVSIRQTCADNNMYCLPDYSRLYLLDLSVNVRKINSVIEGCFTSNTATKPDGRCSVIRCDELHLLVQRNEHSAYMGIHLRVSATFYFFFFFQKYHIIEPMNLLTLPQSHATSLSKKDAPINRRTFYLLRLSPQQLSICIKC